MLLWIAGFTLWCAVSAVEVGKIPFGILAEQEAFAANVRDDFYLTVVFHIFSPDVIQNTSQCPDIYQYAASESHFNRIWSGIDAYKQATVQELCGEMPQLCQAKNRLSRAKRFLGLAGVVMGLAGVGLALHNGARMDRLEDSLDSVNRNLDKIESFVNQMNVETHHHMHDLENILIVRMNTQASAVNHLAAAVCALSVQSFQSAMYLQHRVIELELDQILQTVSHGKLDPRLLPKNVIRTLTARNRELAGTVYDVDPMLIYQTATPYLLDYDKRTKTISFSVQIPKIDPREVAPLYKVTNFGFHDPETDEWYSIDTPDYYYSVGTNESIIPTPVHPSHCASKGVFKICRRTLPNQQMSSHCLASLYATGKVGSQCLVKYRGPSIGTISYTTATGVILRGVSTVRVTRHIASQSAAKDILLNPKKCSYIKFSEFETLSYKDTVIHSPLTPFETEDVVEAGVMFYPVLVSFDHNESLPDNLTLQAGLDNEVETLWLDRQVYSSKNISLRRSLTTGSIYFTLMMIVVGLLALAFLYYRRHLHRRGKKARLRSFATAYLGARPSPTSTQGSGIESFD